MSNYFDYADELEFETQEGEWPPAVLLPRRSSSAPCLAGRRDTDDRDIQDLTLQQLRDRVARLQADATCLVCVDRAQVEQGVPVRARHLRSLRVPLVKVPGVPRTHRHAS
ncbi:hypothetical protein HPB52_013473 [Rhipicephalus sanguineus]|uniref:Uncharacterized protein n=1 Tax=Rhipicephalus sanguineus TaxID=34632 RepID=A0A9D4PW43_RHISA|nr:hypothetical protein HPB52_013473 [Rhipicephalus sanguineus]